MNPRSDFSYHIERMKANPDFIHSYHRTIYADKNKHINKIIDNLAKGYYRPEKYSCVPLNISKKVLVEKYSADIELNKDIYETIYS